MEWAASQGARAFNLFFLVCTGRGQKMTDISPSQYESLLQWLAATDGRRDGMMIRARCAPHFRRVVAQRDPRSPLLAEDASACLAGAHYARILPNGDVTPCPYLLLVAGNVRETRFSEIWHSAAVFHTLRAPQLAGRCGVCEFASACGGCRARALATGGDYLGEDPWCTYQPGEGPRVELTPVTWSAEAEARLERVPAFLRGMVRRRVEARARERGMDCVTVELMREVRERVRQLG
jgi:radical SAM protein with 4Fe4S-binding SPASM domain